MYQSEKTIQIICAGTSVLCTAYIGGAQKERDGLPRSCCTYCRRSRRGAPSRRGCAVGAQINGDDDRLHLYCIIPASLLRGRPSTLTYQGFKDDHSTFMADHADEVADIEDVYNLCKVIPLSRATPDETGINNGTVKSFSTLFFVR